MNENLILSETFTVDLWELYDRRDNKDIEEWTKQRINADIARGIEQYIVITSWSDQHSKYYRGELMIVDQRKQRKKIKLQLYLPEDLEKKLAEEAKQKKTTIHERVRSILTSHFDKKG